MPLADHLVCLRGSPAMMLRALLSPSAKLHLFGIMNVAVVWNKNHGVGVDLLGIDYTQIGMKDGAF